MPQSKSTMMPLGTVAPAFSLPDTVSGNTLSLSDVKSEKGTVVMFICNHCPYVIYVQDKVVELACDFQNKGVGFVAISANDVENYPEDAPDLMKEHAEKHNFPFPYLYDESQQVAKAFDAACTPDFFVFDSQGKCVYRGRMDGATPGNNVPVTGEELKMALNYLVEGLPIDTEQHSSIGCGIKWKK
ncbi:thioredoxin family protein [Reichenbachiella carrageenanivorans]|uniref:Thioredoxin family protein n=1 Tax=Reichenbachiella carrageenanivorans TaxID=2979869 RepID=A0ABY6D5F6_9BACT|nr:thioredoxin family protein [Reichenbachiella carrageenanivorans]UXX81129.1 thioredoxin family protein [Reichenbachiella carrageenanivorans]